MANENTDTQNNGHTALTTNGSAAIPIVGESSPNTNDGNKGPDVDNGSDNIETTDTEENSKRCLD